MKVAIFDFDGTLYEKETFPLLMNQLRTHPTYHKHYNKFYFSILPVFIAYKLKLYPELKMRYSMMKKYLAVFKGLTEKDIIAYYAEIAETMKEDFNEKVIARMLEHKEDGYHIMVVSGAFTPLLDAVLKDLPIDTMIGTKIPYQNGIYDPKGKLIHVQAERKTELIHENLKEYKVDWDNSYAYGDSFSDLSVLEVVGNPVAVQPDEKLKAIATDKNWEII